MIGCDLLHFLHIHVEEEEEEAGLVNAFSVP